MNVRISFFAVVLTVAIMTSLSLAADWPQWRGPNRTGVATNAQINTDWQKQPPRITWRTNVGEGYSGIAVVDGKAYTIGHKDDKDHVVCLDVKDGKEIWKYSYPASSAKKWPGPRSTPTVHDGRVYTTSRDGALFCLDAKTGARLWQADLKRMGAKIKGWGFASSPLILGDKVIVDAGPLLAFNLKTGAAAWKAGDNKTAFSSPYAFEHGGKTYIASLPASGLVITDAATGNVVATHAWKTSYDVNAATPIYHDGHIFISTGYKSGCVLLKFDGKSLKPVYQNTNLLGQIHTAVLHEGHLYGYFKIDELRCIDFKTGELKWKERGMSGGVTLADGHLLTISKKGELFIAPASPDGFKPKGKIDVLSGECWTVPTPAEGKVFCRNTAGDVVCVDVSGK